jgi:Phage head-tail joining protein
MKPPHLGELRYTIQIVRRVTLPPAPFSAESSHVFTPVLTTRAKAETKQGVAEFNRVSIGDATVTDVFTIRFTTIPFDIRDMVRSATSDTFNTHLPEPGLATLYKILSVEHVDHGRRWIRIHCSQAGGTDRESIQ